MRGRVSDFISSMKKRSQEATCSGLAAAETYDENRMSEDEALKLVFAYREQGLSLKGGKARIPGSGYSKNELTLCNKK